MAVLELLDSTGTKVAQLDRQDCEVSITRKLNAEWTISIMYPIPPTDQGEDKSQYLTAWNYQAKADDQTFIITRTIKQRKPNGSVVIVATGEHKAILEMNAQVITDTLSLMNITPEDALTKVLSYTSGSRTWATGTIGPTNKIFIEVSYETVMSGLQKILTACDGEYDVDEANGEIDISASLGANNNVHIRPGHNLETLKNTQYSRNILNKIYGVGGGQPPITIAGARHVVSNMSVATINTIGDKVVAEDDAYNAGYSVKFATGAQAGNSFDIIDCTAGGSGFDVIVLASTPSPAVVAGDKFFIMAGSDQSPYIPATTSINTYGTFSGVKKDERFVDATNLVTTPALDGTYTAGLCQDWTEEGSPSTKAENTDTDYIQYGTKSQKIIGVSDGDGVSQASIPVTSGEYYRLTAWVYIGAGSVRIEFTFASVTYSAVIDSTGWQRFSIVERSGAATATVKIIQDGASAATFYVDAVQVTYGILERSFTTNSDLKSLWDLTYDLLIEKKDPLVEYVANFIDLNRMSPEDYPFDSINLGDTVTIIDDELGISDVTARVKKIQYDIFRPEITKHTVSNIV